MSEEVKLLKPDGEPVEPVEETTAVAVSKKNPTMSVLRGDNIFVLAIPLKHIPWSSVKIILAEAFQELAIMFHYIEKKNQESAGSGLAVGVGQFMKKHIDKFVGKA